MAIMEWKDFDFESCPDCGGTLQACTSAPDGMFHDGDSVRCLDCEFMSGMSVDEDGEAWVKDT